MKAWRALGKKPNAVARAQFASLLNYKDNQFQNLEVTPALSEDTNLFKVARAFFRESKNTVPSKPIPFVETDLKDPALHDETFVWFGHSSYLLYLEGMTFLVDPVFSGQASPIPNTVKAFEGANHYQAAHLPAIDVLLLTHDHWDHLDYETIQALKSKVNYVICGLGVAAHLLYWGWEKEHIFERNWQDEITLTPEVSITLTPARHFSGRLLQRNTSLWTSFVLKTSSQTIFIGGDSGYGKHFKAIGDQYGPFDYAILECGQYNEKWPYIHTLGEELTKELADLNAAALIPVHHSKFKLAQHPWNEPLQLAVKAAAKGDFLILTPKIGEAVSLKAPKAIWDAWWEF